jgi:ribosomal protein S18 acetylase RimI-like enzyme
MSADLVIRPFAPADTAAIVALWRTCGLVHPQNDPHRDIARKLAVDPEGFLVGTLEGRVVASVMVGYEGHRGWINYLAVVPELQGGGLGREIMLAAERLLRARGCPKINLMVRGSNRSVLEFYRRLGYAQDDVVSMGKRLEHDDRPDATGS